MSRRARFVDPQRAVFTPYRGSPSVARAGAQRLLLWVRHPGRQECAASNVPLKRNASFQRYSCQWMLEALGWAELERAGAFSSSGTPEAHFRRGRLPGCTLLWRCCGEVSLQRCGAALVAITATSHRHPSAAVSAVAVAVTVAAAASCPLFPPLPSLVRRFLHCRCFTAAATWRSYSPKPTLG